MNKSIEYLADNNILANDILSRNYYYPFRHGERAVEFNFSTANSCISCIDCICANNCLNKYYLTDESITNFKHLLDWYINNEFKCDIYLSGLNAEESLKILLNLYLKFRIANYLDCGTVFVGIDVKELTDQVISQISDINETLKIKLNIKLTNDNISYLTSIDRDFLNKYCNLYFEVNSATTKEIIDIITHYNVNVVLTNSKEELIKFNTNPTILYNIIDYFCEKDLNNFTGEDITKFLITDRKAANRFYQLKLNTFSNGTDFIDCNLNKSLVIDCNTLDIILCNNLKDFKLGTFEYIENEIKYFKFDVVELFAIKDHAKYSCMPHCESCPYFGICNYFCFANSYTTYNNLLMPIKKQCKVYELIYQYIIKKYKSIFETNIDKLSCTKLEKKYLFSLLNDAVIEGELLWKV